MPRTNRSRRLALVPLHPWCPPALPEKSLRQLLRQVLPLPLCLLLLWPPTPPPVPSPCPQRQLGRQLRPPPHLRLSPAARRWRRRWKLRVWWRRGIP